MKDKTAEPVRVVNFADFLTRSRANEGVTVPLPLPDGKASGIEITIRSTDSDAFQEARNVKLRENLAILALPEDQREAAELTAEIKLLSSLVAGWTIPDRDCTPEAIRELLTEAPYIRNFVDSTAAKKSAFFELKPVG